MFDPTADPQNPLAGLPPIVLRQTADEALPSGLGGFRLGSYYSGEQSKLSRRQFTGKAILNLLDPADGEAAVAISDIALLSLAYVKSTGHDVVVPELQRPNLLVPVTGTLSSRNEQVHFVRKCEPWILFGRGTRETTALPAKDAPYQAFVLSIPPHFLGDRLARVEAQGGMVRGDASSDDDLHLARLTLELAMRVSLSADEEMQPRLADAWTTVILNQINLCLEAQLGTGVRELSENAGNPSFRHVRKAEELIYERPNEIDGLQDIALHAGVSERTLQAAFRKVRGATPMQVLTQARLHCARRALIDHDGPKTVTDVCSSCGIEHHGRFSKLYRKVFGENPAATLNSRK